MYSAQSSGSSRSLNQAGFLFFWDRVVFDALRPSEGIIISAGRQDDTAHVNRPQHRDIYQQSMPKRQHKVPMGERKHWQHLTAFTKHRYLLQIEQFDIRLHHTIYRHTGGHPTKDAPHPPKSTVSGTLLENTDRLPYNPFHGTPNPNKRYTAANTVKQGFFCQASSFDKKKHNSTTMATDGCSETCLVYFLISQSATSCV